jgi:hypothetical protein
MLGIADDRSMIFKQLLVCRLAYSADVILRENGTPGRALIPEPVTQALGRSACIKSAIYILLSGTAASTIPYLLKYLSAQRFSQE